MSESDRGAEGHRSEGQASACPKFEARDAMKQDVQKHVPPKPERRHPIHLAPFEGHNVSVIIFVTTCTAPNILQW
ncbi:MAG: hypothetical protein QOJ36_428 [Verrucomicrobiota bacterium]